MSNITVVAQRDRRRIGRRFPARTGVIIDSSKLSEEEAAALQADKLLVVHEGELEGAVPDTLPRRLDAGEPQVGASEPGKPKKPVTSPTASRKNNSAAERKHKAKLNAEARAEAKRRQELLAETVKTLGEDVLTDGALDQDKLKAVLDFEPTAAELETLAKA